LEIKLKTLTPIWTGGADGKCDRLHETGIIGSLRWWYEALVRGLGGYACDPTIEGRCPDKNGMHCAVCELFGCTGWARKFRLRILDENGNLLQGDLMGRNIIFILEFRELRSISKEEEWLLLNTIEIAALYGAIGGKTTSLLSSHGLVKLDTPINKPKMQSEKVKEWLQTLYEGQSESEWADLRRFIFVPKKALREDPRKVARRIDPDFLLGKKNPEQSRKIFVFKNPDRTFAYLRNMETYQKVLKEWNKVFGTKSIRTGEEVLNGL
jgi:CRISPR-associated protein Cmr1